ncbi:MAG: hypothetical protein WA231_03385, partial [Methylocella sp.]
PALSFADVGVAIKLGADIAHESAAIVLLDDSLWKLVRAIELSRSASATGCRRRVSTATASASR